MQYLRRTDSHSVLGTAPMVTINDVLTHGGFAEIIYAPMGDRSNWYLNALGNWVSGGLLHDPQWGGPCNIQIPNPPLRVGGIIA